MALWEMVSSCAGMVLRASERVHPADRSAGDEIALLTANVCAYALIALICKVIILTQPKVLVLEVCLLFRVCAPQGSVKPLSASFPLACCPLSSCALHPVGRREVISLGLVPGAWRAQTLPVGVQNRSWL